MLVAVCVGTLLMVWFARARRKGPPRLEAHELRRLRRLSDKFHRDSIHPFVEP
jgi:hypothetical protein